MSLIKWKRLAGAQQTQCRECRAETRNHNEVNRITTSEISLDFAVMKAAGTKDRGHEDVGIVKQER